MHRTLYELISKQGGELRPDNSKITQRAKPDISFANTYSSSRSQQVPLLKV